MRTVNNLPDTVTKEENLALFPDSTVVNQTPTKKGTPVVREIYGDPLTNIYAILRASGIEPNGNEDNEQNGYQLLEALKVLPNELGSIERILNKTGNTFSIDLNISLLPNKYFLLVKSAENYSGVASFFKGSTELTYSFQSEAFSTGDELILVIDSAGVRAYKIGGSASSAVSSEVFTVMGTPLAFNDSDIMWYFDNGKLYNDNPFSVDLKTKFINYVGNSNLEIYEVFIVKNNLVFCVFFTDNSEYKVFKISLNDINTDNFSSLSVIGGDIGQGVDYKTFFYCSEKFLYITNRSNSTDGDYFLDIYSFDQNITSITFSSNVELDLNFKKSTNTVIHNDRLFQLVAGDLRRFTLSSVPSVQLSVIQAFVGVLFKFKGACYYSSGEVAKKWNLS